MTEIVVDPTMVERVARAIWMENQPAGAPAFDDLDFLDQGRVKMIALACIKVMREPTDEMIKAGDDEIPDNKTFLNDAKGVYQTMIDAALKED